MRRVSVVGNSGSGKSTLARRIAAALDAPYIELDAIHHLPGWTPIPVDRFLAEMDRRTRADRWVVDGNFRRVVVEGPVWERADTVVWLDPPRHVVMRQLIGRTLRRAITREELWNGNREPVLRQFSPDPRRSIIVWAWTRHRVYRRRYAQAMRDRPDLAFVRLRSHREAEAWLRGLGTAAATPDAPA